MIKEKQIIKTLYYHHLVKASMESYFQEGADDNYLSPKDEICPFLQTDVKCIYTFHKEKGKGVWFCLNDGSIWDENFQQEIPLTVEKFI